VSVLEMIAALTLSPDTANHAASMGRNLVHELAQAREHALESAHALARIAVDCSASRDWDGLRDVTAVSRVLKGFAHADA
jgi:hypothetical protein